MNEKNRTTSIQSPTRFNIRVYGIAIRNGKILLSEEQGKHHFTKFPGGGLEPGEGIADCLQREILEETGIRIRSFRHFYTTDFFQQSAFRPEDQVIAVYYLMDADWPDTFESVTEMRFGHEYRVSFFWISLADLKEEMLSFPIDRHVCRKIMAGEWAV